MRTRELSWTHSGGWQGARSPHKADLVLYFGNRAALACGARYRELQALYPDAHILGCSAGGQIRNDDVTDEEIAAVALCFDSTRLRMACEPARAPDQSRHCGEAIGRALRAEDLTGIFVLSDGLNVNGSELVAGITGTVGTQV